GVAKRKVYRQVTEHNLGLAIDDGAGSDTEIDFGFHDSGGVVSASMHACYHWFELYVSALAETKGTQPSPLDEIAQRHGFKIAQRPPPLAELLKTCAEPLIELRKQLFGTDWYQKQPMLVSDELEGQERIEFEDLTPKERAEVEAALEKKQCDCRVCA